MIIDSLAMSVDAFTYLFNLIAERLKHKQILRHQHESQQHLAASAAAAAASKQERYIQDQKRQQRLFRLNLEFIPPLISVIALVAVSSQALIDAITVIINESDIASSPILEANANDGIFDDIILEQQQQQAQAEMQSEPNVHTMLVFSTLNLILDLMNVTVFAKSENDFTIPLCPCCGEHDSTTLCDDLNDENDLHYDDEEEEVGTACTYTCCEETHLLPCGISDDGNNGTASPTLSPTSNESQNPEWMTDDLSLDIIHEDDDERRWGSTNSLLSMETGTIDPCTSNIPLDCTKAKDVSSVILTSHSSSSDSSNINTKPKLSKYGQYDTFTCDNDNHKCDEDTCSEEDSEESNDILINLNMCSAYTHVMADTLRSAAVLIASGIACSFDQISPTMADASGAIIVSIIIAISLGPLLIGLVQIFHDIRAVRREIDMAKLHDDERVCKV